MRKIPIIEVFLSLISVWWAIVLFSDEHFLDGAPRQFDKLVEFQEHFWGSFFLFAAFIKVLGIVTEKAIFRKIGLIMSAFLYATITSGHILADAIMDTRTGVYFALSLLALYGLREVANHGPYKS